MAGLFAVAFSPLPQVAKVIGMAIVLVLIVFLNRGSIYYARANSFYQKNDEASIKKAFALYQKAFKAGISSKFEITVGSIAIQIGELDYAKKVLNDAIATATKKEQNNKAVAKTALSMAYWIEGDLDEAIRICEEVYNGGYKDCNIYINLLTYYLEKEDLANFRKLIKEYKSSTLKSPALTDLNAAYHILNGEWDKANTILRQMLESKDYPFADPYVHMAQIKLHYGQYAEARTLIQKSIDTCTFTKTAILTQDLLVKLVDLLTEPEKNAGYIVAINKNPLSLINGKLPLPIKDAVLTFEVEPDFEKQIEETKTVEEGEPNTELTAEDEEWLRSHSN